MADFSGCAAGAGSTLNGVTTKFGRVLGSGGRRAVGMMVKAHPIAAVALLILLFVAPIAEGAGIFLPATGADAPSVSSGMNRPLRDAVEPQMVRVVHAELARARDQAALSGAGSLLFNLPAVHLRGTIERTAPTLGGYSLSGRIDGPRGGFVTLAVHDEAVAGSIWTPDGSYEILPRGGGLHVVRRAVRQQCSGVVADEDGLHPSGSFLPQSRGETDDGLNTVVDVLVVWTPEREEQAGGEAEVRTTIDMWVAYANDAFKRSGAFVTLNLVGAERVEYVEGRHRVEDISRLSDPSDGYMDEVHARRDALSADLVGLSVANGGGLADTLGPFSLFGAAAWVFTHEIGHNFGIGHDRYTDFSIGHQYNAGRVVLNPRCIVTIMAYKWQCDHAGFPDYVVPYFASPLRYYGSGPRLGVWRFSGVRTTDGPADAVATINRNRYAVAAFRR